MIFLKKVNALVLGLAVLLAFGCGGDEPEPDNNPSIPDSGNFTNCKITQFIADSDSVGYIYNYDQQGRIVQANRGKRQKEFFQYSTLGKVSKLKIWRTGEDTVEVINYEYNTDTLLSKITRLRRATPGGPFTPFVIRSFAYDSQKRQINTSYHDVTQPGIVLEKIDFSYPGNNSVKQVSSRFNTSNNSWILTLEADITYDNQKTPWERKEDHFSIIMYNEPFLKGNETYWKGTFYNQGPPPYSHTSVSTYTYNSAGYPTERVSVRDGNYTTLTKFSYTCQ